ncbi:hypothetical protein ASD24_24175 [Paenibacillus sp. Root52]|uniref:hypothetical protein n=1 Tax=Paenibacillus sp. Root52 TaxID=1736552 RepID=UPI0006F5B1D8|nr:hypothetical protein [Paenibacillus sp. Root52]KQY91211.1 hypothetical protein ASD24_24175 [Paenibacillus sp. Root52]
MSNKIIDFYKGYEGEPEIQISYSSKNEGSVTLRIWEGYFDNIMMGIKADSNHWTALAYYYHLHEGWYENSPWVIPDIDAALEQLELVNKAEFYDETQEILKHFIEILMNAKSNNEEVWIAYD